MGVQERPVEILRTVIQPYTTDDRALHLLAAQLYEVFDGCQTYADKYQSLLSLPEGEPQRREALGEVLVEIKVLLDDLMWHMQELRSLIDPVADDVFSDREVDAATQDP